MRSLLCLNPLRHSFVYIYDESVYDINYKSSQLSKNGKLYDGYATYPTEEINTVTVMNDWRFFEFIKSITHESVDICGLSLGGWLSLHLSIHQPEMINKLILMNPAGLKINPFAIFSRNSVFNNVCMCVISVCKLSNVILSNFCIINSKFF